MFALVLRKAAQTRRFTITDIDSSGWEVRDEQDSHVIRRVLYTDWHRVERAKMNFAREASSLRDAGWIEV